MSWPQRFLEYATLALLVAVAAAVAFCAEDASSLRTRLWSVRWRWAWAAEDVTRSSALLGRTVTVTSTRATALHLLREVIGDL